MKETKSQLIDRAIKEGVPMYRKTLEKNFTRAELVTFLKNRKVMENCKK